MKDRRNSMKSNTKDTAEGKKQQMKGKIKEVVGKIVKNRDLEGEGEAENLAYDLRVVDPISPA
jgi:uncharacterized protein YjbJ (UPF0337 family)